MRIPHSPLAMSTIALCTFVADASAQSSVTVFGVMDLALRQTHVSGTSRSTTLASGGLAGSRFGVRGAEDLGGGLAASFWLEADVAADTGATVASAFWSRRSTVSLSSADWGELRLGRDYVPIFARQYSFLSPFGPNGVASNGNLFFGPPSLLGSGSGGGVRTDNMLKYVLPPDLGGLYGEVMASMAEGRNENRHRGGVIGYAAGPLMVNAGFGRTDDVAGRDAIRLTTLGAAYDAGWAKFMALVQRASYGARRQTTVEVGAAVPLAGGSLKASLRRADQSGAGTEANDARQLSLGYVYALSKRSTLYGSFSRIDNQGAQAFGLGGTVPPAGRGVRGLELGINHLF